MTSDQAFTLSTHRLDFGAVSPGTKPIQNLFLTKRSSGSFSFQVQLDQPWVSVDFGEQAGNDLTIRVTIDGSQLAGGRQSATLSIQALGKTVNVTVTATRVGTSKPPPERWSDSRERESRDRESQDSSRGSRPDSSGARRGRSDQSCGRVQPVGTGVSLSLPLAVLFLSLLFGTVYSLALEFITAAELGPNVGVAPGGLDAARQRDGGAPNAPYEAAVVVAVVAVLYLLVAMHKILPHGGTTLVAGSTNPEQRRLYEALTDVCQRAGLGVPPVVIRPLAAPNLRSYGLNPWLCCLYVNQGLLTRLTDRGELSAVLAHEIAHIARYDTLFFCVFRPPLWLISRLLRLVQGLVGALRSGVRGASLGPMLPLMILGGNCAGGCGLVGCLVTLFVVMMMAVMAGALISYGLVAVAALLAFSAGCLLYWQHTEFQADYQAARILGHVDPVIAALGRTGDYWPTEKAALEQFAAVHLGRSSGYALEDIVACLKSGADPAAGMGFGQRLFRTHPLLVQRIGGLVRAFGSELA